MCQCLSFLAYPCPGISERWALWKLELRRLIARISAYNGPFTGLEVRHISIQGSLTTYSSTGARVRLTVAMGTCMSSSSSPKKSTGKQAGLFAKRQQPMDLVDPASAPTLPAKRSRDKNKKEGKGENGPVPCTLMERGLLKRVSANGFSNFACLFSQQGRKGINQDAMIVWEDFGCQEDAVFCGVFDGHGPYGHVVAQIVRDLLPVKLASNFEAIKTTSTEQVKLGTVDEANQGKETLEGATEASSTVSEMFSLWKESFLTSFILMDKELQGKANVDCFCSGTTAVTLVKQGNDVIIGNVGDSRAILGTKADNGAIIAVPLTVDLKPNLPQEAERIRQCRGRVFALQDEPDVHRVWLPHENSPGLAMARAFGDFCLKNFGVIAVPEVTHHHLTDKDQFIVLATDGIWDVLSNKEVVDIVSSVPSRALAARAVVEMAIHAWRAKFPTSKIDDCAAVCLFTKEMVVVPPGRSFKKQQGLPVTPRRRLSAKPNMAENSHREKSKEASQKRVVSTSPGGPFESQSERMDNAVQEAGESSQILAGNAQDSAPNEDERDQSLNDGEDEGDWSALDGVTRVNSLVNLPRFTPGDLRAGG